MKSLIIAAAFFVLSQVAFATPIKLSDCSEVGATMENMIFGADYQKTFYKGAVGLVVYDTIEPAAASYGIAIVHNEPEEAPEGFIIRKCLAISFLSGVDLKNATSSYSPKTGVTVIVPTKQYDHLTGGLKDAKISINIRTVHAGKIDEGHVVTAKEL